jgi:hypothetical protein
VSRANKASCELLRRLPLILPLHLLQADRPQSPDAQSFASLLFFRSSATLLDLFAHWRITFA